MTSRYLLALGLLVLVTASGWPNDGSKNWDYTELQKAPEKDKAKKNPMRDDPDAPVAGAILFENHCEECHGANAEGTRKGPSLRVKEVQDAAPGAIFWILTNGVVRKKMPVWSKLPEQQRWQLVSYVKSLSGANSKK
jgi:mono/diheme cytochrome c family protein